MDFIHYYLIIITDPSLPKDLRGVAIYPDSLLECLPVLHGQCLYLVVEFVDLSLVVDGELCQEVRAQLLVQTLRRRLHRVQTRL